MVITYLAPMLFLTARLNGVLKYKHLHFLFFSVAVLIISAKFNLIIVVNFFSAAWKVLLIESSSIDAMEILFSIILVSCFFMDGGWLECLFIQIVMV